MAKGPTTTPESHAWTDAEIMFIERCVQAEMTRSGLNAKQLASVAAIILGALGIAGGVLGTAGYLIITSAAETTAKITAKETAGNVAAETVVDELLEHGTVETLIENVAGAVPEGAVAAFTTSCPDGWESFTGAEGRFILGVGQGPLKKAVRLEEPGGEEEVALQDKQLPSHAHPFDETNHFNVEIVKTNQNKKIHVSPAGDYPVNFSKSAAREGDGHPHNNMPPFIALQFCKKS